MNNTHSMSGRDKQLLILVLGILTCLGPLAIDLYLPAMPAIAESMNEPLGSIQLTLSAYTLGFALGQLIFGPLADRFGRLRVMVPGLVFYIGTTLLSAFTNTANELIVARILQAMSGAAVMVTIPAMVRDMFDREDCARIMSSILLVMTVAPLIAPLLGGQLLLLGGWRSLFITLALFGCAALVLALFMLKESLPEEHRQALTAKQLAKNYLSVITHRNAMGCILGHGFFFGGLFAFISASPFVYIELYGIAPEYYGFLFAANIIAMGICNIINMRLIGRFPLLNMLRCGTAFAALSGLLLLFMAVTGAGGLLGIVIPVVLFVGMLGFTGPNSNALALSYFPGIAGTANAAAGILRFGIGGITAGLAGVFHNGTAVPMAALIAGCGLCSVLSVMLVKDRKIVSRTPINDEHHDEPPRAAA